MSQDTVVVDLDGTLANIEHRVPLVQSEKPNWPKFFTECVNDDVNEWCVTLMRAMRTAGFRVLLVSARSKECIVETNAWLMANADEAFDEFHMLREKGDYTMDEILKQAWLDSYGKERVLFVVDDRTRVVDMWRRNGITCLQCARWDEWKKPKKATAAAVQA